VSLLASLPLLCPDQTWISIDLVSACPQSSELVFLKTKVSSVE
jgi:hypothetical protein